MTPLLLFGLVGLGLAVVVVRRRSVALALVALQSLAIAAFALTLVPGRSVDFAIAASALLLRDAGLTAVLALSIQRTREPRRVHAGIAPLSRLAVAIAAAIALAALVPPFGLDSRIAEHAAVAMVTAGIVTVMTRRLTVFQVLGLLLAENGVAVAALSVAGGLPLPIELGAAFDLIVVVSVATAFHERIFGAFGSGDSSLLGDLRG